MAKRSEKKRRPTEKQQHFKGQEPIRVKAIDELAEEVSGLTADRLEIQAEEREARGKLLELMKEHKLDEYRVPGTNLIVTRKFVDEKVSVTKERDRDQG